MAEVYLARIEGMGGFEKLVALKRIHPHYASGEGFGSMLLDEAKLSVSLSHRNIVQTLDLAHVDGRYVIVMEYVEGYDAHGVLDMLRKEGRLFEVDLAAHVIAEVCRGLDYAHQHRDERGEPAGIVHRDISPQNVLLSLAGEVKIADFGIAKAASRRSDPEAGVIKGKYFYMSPEQAWAEPVDCRSDIFSAGVVLWELLAGHRLHEASDVQSLLDAVRRAEVPAPSSLRKEVPAEVDAIIERATALSPADRFPDAGSMVDALSAYLASRPPVDAAQQLGQMLAELPPPSASSPAADIPHTRDRVVTQSLWERATSVEPPLRHDMDDGEPTLAGWRSPKVRRSRYARLWVLGACSVLVGLVLWIFYGS